MPALVDRTPRAFLILGVPLLAFLITVGISLATSGGDDGSSTPALAVSVSQQQPLPTAVPPTPTVVPTAVPIRTDCAAIRGTDYRSGEERDWYQKNCSGPATTTASSNTSTSSSGGVRPVTGSSAPSGGQYALGDTLIIPSIGVNAPVYGTKVGAGGSMPDPAGYFNAVWYDFSDLPGLGGYATGGNLVMAGHVDSAIYGAAVFYYMKNLGAGDSIQYRMSDGQVVSYVVTGVGDYLPEDDWTGIVASGTADLTLITCIGTFDRTIREYSHRRVVFARKA